MKYSNVHESFISFLKDKHSSEVKGISDRIYNFLLNNRQFGYESDTKLPGLAPLDRIAQDIVITPVKLRSFIKGGNYEGARIVHVRSNVWNGDIVVFMSPESKDSNRSLTSKRYYSGKDYFDTDYRTLGDKHLSNKDRKYYTGSTSNRVRYNRTNEGIFSDYKQYLKRGRSNVEDNYDFDDILGRVTYFLYLNPEFDYHEVSDTPGIIFLSNLSKQTKVPYKSLVEFFKKSPLQNSALVQFKSGSIEGPIVLFGKPEVDRRSAWMEWKSEADQEEVLDQKREIRDVNYEIPKKPFEERISSTQIRDIDDSSIVKNIDMDISPEVDEKRRNELVSESLRQLNTLMEGIDRSKIKTPDHQMFVDYFVDLTDRQKELAIRGELNSLLDGPVSTIKTSPTLSKIFIESKTDPNKLYVKEDVADASLKFATYLWNELPTVFIQKLQE